MPAKRASAINHVSARLDEAIIARIDALALLLAPTGTKASRSTAVRACILAGLEVLEAQPAKPEGGGRVTK